MVTDSRRPGSAPLLTAMFHAKYDRCCTQAQDQGLCGVSLPQILTAHGALAGRHVRDLARAEMLTCTTGAGREALPPWEKPSARLCVARKLA